MKPDPLFRHVLSRRSLKEPFDTTRPVSRETLSNIISSIERPQGRVDAIFQPDDIAVWRKLTRQAMDIEIKTHRTYKESVDLFRIGKAEVEANPDGIAFSGPLFDALGLFNQFNRTLAMDSTSSVYQQGIGAVMANIDTAMGYLWIVTAGNSRLDQIDTGCNWLRLNLASTAAGVGFHPLSQILQEYPEMTDLYREAHRLLAPQGGTVQMISRVGYGPNVGPSPRWELEKRVLTKPT